MCDYMYDLSFLSFQFVIKLWGDPLFPFQIYMFNTEEQNTIKMLITTIT